MSYAFNPFTGTLDYYTAGSSAFTTAISTSVNGALSAPGITGTGTWITGGTATTTKPYVLIEPTGTTSTAWSTAGTGLGINATTGFAGNLLDAQVNGTSQCKVDKEGFIYANRLISGTNFSLYPAAAGTNFASINGILQIIGAPNLNPSVKFLPNSACNQTSNSFTLVSIAPNYNQTSGTAANTDLLINRTETAIGSGAQLLIDAGVGGGSYVSQFNLTNKGQLNLPIASLVSQPILNLTGTWFTGGTATTTKPHFLIEPTGATSTAWSTAGTGIGINAAAGFTGNLIDAQLNGASKMLLTSDGQLSFPVLTTNSQLKIGTFEFQGYAINNAWLGENFYWDGANFKYRANGYATQWYHQGLTSSFRVANTGSAGGNISFTAALTLWYNGGQPAVSVRNPTSIGTYTALTVYTNGTADNLAATQLNPINSTGKPLVAQGAASQTANLTEWQNSSGRILASISKDGFIGISSGTLNTGGGYVRKLAEAASDALSGASGSIAVNVPSGARILGVQLRVDTLITSGDGATSWTAAYVNTPTTAICSGQAFTKNTKFNAIHPAYEVTTGTVTITITPNSNTFSAGVVRAVVYYEEITALGNAA